MGPFVVDEGRGPAVVFLHGYPLCGDIWRNQRILSDSYRLIIPDLPGFGETDAADLSSIREYADWVSRLLQERGIDRAIVVGHSMGGYIALALVIHHASQCAGLALICTQAHADTVEGRHGRLEAVQRVEREGVGFLAETMSEKLLHPESPESLRIELARFIRKASPKGVVCALRAMADRPDVREQLNSVHQSALVLYGSGDRLFSAERPIELAKRLPHSVIHACPRSGHMPMMEEPEMVTRRLREFFATCHE